VASEFVFERDGVRLAGLDFGGKGASFLLLHGLAGYAGEWTDTAGWLTERGRLVALDARGHGGSEWFPADVSPAAHVADAVFAIDQLRLGPVVVIGQSFGGLTALRLAAARPELVRGLVVADAGPGAGSDDLATQVWEGIGASLRRWPVPFASREAAVAFWEGPSLRADAWANGLERRNDGWWPRFDVDVMVQTLREASTDESWDVWEQISCPVLVARAARGGITVEYAAEMADRGRNVQVVEIADAGHDLHLNRPAEWGSTVSAFVDSLGPPNR
jgi:pimeloyl-ACP methyl ester carboxylesterase